MKRRAALLPLQAVVRRTGLSADVIRVWERRYAAVTPARTATNRRMYSEAEVERLLLLVRATRLGRHVGQVAALPTRALRDLVARDETAQGLARAPVPAARPSGSPARFLEKALGAVRALDGAALDDLLGRAGVALPRAALLEEVIAPLMVRIGVLWQEGEIRVAHEHLASAVVRNCLAQLARPRGGRGAPALVSATPSGQGHEFGALLAALVAEEAGFDVTYLGPNLPVEEIASAAERVGAVVVALSLVHPADDPRLGADLARLRRLLGPDVLIVVGGAAAPSYAEALRRTGADHIDSLAGLRARLHALRAPRAAAAPA